MKIFYIGGFPPPFGGVTIKNKMLFDNLAKYVEIEKIDLNIIKRKNFIECIKLFAILINPFNTLIIGSASKSRRFFSGLLYYINRKALNRSLLIIMGGVSSRIIANDTNYLKWVSEYNQIYVEADGMKSELIAAGAKNVSVFPNCRETPSDSLEIKEVEIKKIRCLYFSLVSKDKGADIVLLAAEILDKRNVDFSIDFYGHIDDNYRLEFTKSIEKLNSVKYFGVFESNQEKLYSKLQQYDILLLPTRWKAEGVPGVLVEAKIAGLPAIVSNINYNSEIVENGKTGIVLHHNTSDELAYAIESVYSDRDWLMKMKRNAKYSSENYLVENYIEDIVEILRK